MEFKEYQENASKTAIYPRQYGLAYPTLGLAGEAGEVAEKVKKILRDNNGICSEDQKREIAKELGDILWYVSAVCTELDLDMGLVAYANIQKLKSRKERGVISGSGDNR